ncbi:MAG: hypothetical protein A3J55_00525 [Candidatus Ryanbacteria bacterium RIFCSPHIGHO2_02_FULL_45_17b]|uniref:DUF218 domain-containing protein n=1 Tax=Candidatus Ryanbacteria bacterium RIFCSPHIGHO2_01_FULL_45_22 TaxID=1802114 RepID=A0A1G2G0Q0_9BACT|nr:MAG: hypothetical protein A2719_02990 [Candidatus Ryanbacteria bacterium RIFCSPHIGHO2_01_FULL_45_22]OGZ47027.1 MAG: hypothetical protein A3J55_00525 [Candidatus Ryanbacteria bacterium RIFCSPHIGHO2_02_FULL_45_17b]
MKETLIVPLTKSPHPRGRIGPTRWQDWFRGLRRAVTIAKVIPNAEILILSNVRVANQPHEADLYSEALAEMGVISFRVIRECYETIEQINYSIDLAIQERKNLIFVSTFLHYLRVEWLILTHPDRKLVEVKHYSVLGIPRPKEALTDIVLTVLFPLIDLVGGRQWFLRAVNSRRLTGKH